MRSISAVHVRERLRRERRRFSGEMPLSDGTKGAVVGALSRSTGSDRARRVVLAWLFADLPEMEKSSTTLTDGEWHALHRWIGFWQDDEGRWHNADEFRAEVLMVLTAALKTYADFASVEEWMLGSAVALGGEVKRVTPPTSEDPAWDARRNRDGEIW